MRPIGHPLHIWRKSTYSGPSDGCVEVAKVTSHGIGVRDSKDVVASPILYFEPAEWRAFLGTVKTGRLDLA